jgi:peptidoglycan/LPS O-acetylase OafA/YrhL
VQSKNVAYDPRLDHLRALAALTVLMFHAKLAAVGHPSDLFALPWIDQGHVGVALFMVISGFIFARIAERGTLDVPRFYLSRVLRIYPLLVTVLAVTCFSAADPTADSGAAIHFLVALLPLPQPLPPAASQMWSVAVEIQFYLLFPLLHSELEKRGWRGYVTLLVFLVTMRLAVYAHLGTVHRFAYFSLFGAMDAFIFGFIASKVARDRTAPVWLPAVVLVGFSAVLWFAFRSHRFFHVDYGGPNLYAISTSGRWIIWPTLQAALCAALVGSYMACRVRLPGAGTIAWIGTASYSIYGWHSLVILALSRWLPAAPWLTPYGFGLVVAAVSIPIAALSYRVIERPFLEMRVRYLTSAPLRPATMVAAE